VDLPEGINIKIWRQAFITTYMDFAASQTDPWDIPAPLACKKLQLIWNKVFPDIEHTVTTTSAVYLVVSGS
jgi:hypothetical protein